MRNAFVCLLVLLSVQIAAQTTGKILVITDVNADILVDGDKAASTTPGNACKLELSPGEHYVQAQGPVGGNTINNGQVVNVEAGKQQIIHINLLSAPVTAVVSEAGKDTVSIANVDFLIAGSIAVGLWLSDHPGEEYPDYPVYYYILDKGDALLLDFRMDNKKGTNVISIASYPDGNQLYSDNNLVTAKNLSVKIPARGIYGISFSTNHVFDRSCNMRVRKIPGSTESKSLSPAVAWESRRDTVFRWVTDTIVTIHRTAVQVQPPEQRWVNSTSHETFKGGYSRISLPFTLPANTVEWYYIFSADRNKEQLNKTMNTFDLFGDIVTAVDATGVAGFGMSALTTPPGANYCDVFLLDQVNERLFTAGENFRYYEEGSRTNVMSSLVKVSGMTSGTYYIGFRNNDFTYGEQVAIEIVAVTEQHTSETQRRKAVIRIADKKYPVMPG